MPQYGHQDGFDTVALITGPSHVFLGIRFGDGPPQLIKRPPIGSCQGLLLDQGRILEAVRAGLAMANAEGGGSLSAAAVLYVENDSPRYEMFERCAYLLALRHLMGDEHVIYDADRKRRVIISGSPAGYSFVEEHFSNNPLEMCWIPQTHRRSVTVCLSFEIALREARGRVAWLAAAENEG